MGWEIREHLDGDPTKWKPKPRYERKSCLFSIMLHHSGLLVGDARNISYVDGKVDYIDKVDSDELSKIELQNMARACGVTGDLEFYYTSSDPAGCEHLLHIKTDRDVLDLGPISGRSRLVGVFVENHGRDPKEIHCLTENTGLDEVNDGGDGVDDRNGVSEGLEDINDETGGLEESVEDFVEEVVKAESEIDDVSVGSDSEHSDYYDDSDGIYDLDDDNYEKYIDPEVEWMGLKDLKPKEKIEQTVKPAGEDEEEGDDEEEMKPKTQYYKGHKVFNPEVDLEKVKLKGGLAFVSLQDLRNAIKAHAIRWGKEIHYPFNNNRNKVQAKCKHDGCPWYLYASRVPKDATYIIKTYSGSHECPRLDNTSVATSTWLAKKYKKFIRMHSSWTAEELIEHFRDTEKLYFSKWQMYRLKSHVLKKEINDFQFNMLPRYGEEILLTNPGSTVKIKSNLVGEFAYFERFYVCWDALKRGMLEGCRRIIFLDGCHIKTEYGGIILTAVGLDANNGLFPFAYAVVEKETTNSWTWFMELVVKDLEISPEHSYIWTVMSDKQKGLIEAVEATLKDCEHRFCVYHLYDNFKLSYKGLTFKELLWRAAKATRPVDFERVMAEIQAIDQGAYEWLAAKEPHHWSKAYFRTINNSDVLLNNVSESFNSMLVRPRKMEIIQMLEAIRLLLMKRVGLRRTGMMRHIGDFCPNIEQILNQNKVWAMRYSAMWNGHDSFQVDGGMMDTWSVNFKEKTCSCRRWQLTGIPCSHVLSCIPHMGVQPHELLHECYSKETFLKSYGYPLYPLRGPYEWPEPAIPRAELKPPLVSKMPGRPKKHRRRKSVGEKMKPVFKDGRLSRHERVVTCSKCKKQGHNKATCSQESVKVKGKKQPVKKQTTKKKVNKKQATKKQATKGESSPQGPEWEPIPEWEHVPDDFFNHVVHPISLKKVTISEPSEQQPQVQPPPVCKGKGKRKMFDQPETFAPKVTSQYNTRSKSLSQPLPQVTSQRAPEVFMKVSHAPLKGYEGYATRVYGHQGRTRTGLIRGQPVGQMFAAMERLHKRLKADEE